MRGEGTCRTDRWEFYVGLLHVLQISVNQQQVTLAHCTCPRGLHKCHHMASLLVWTEKNVSRTGVACQWSKLQPERDGEASDSVSTLKSTHMWPTNTKAGACCQVTDEDRRFLFTRLAELGRFTGEWWVLLPEPTSNLHSRMFDAITASEAFHSAEDKSAFVLNGMKPTNEERLAIAKATEGQRTNPLWLKYKKHRVTASNFGLVLRAVNRNLFYPSLFKTLLGEYSSSARAASVQWGIDHESCAIQAYSQRTGLAVQPVGLFLSESGLLGASPDGMLDDGNIVEVKCPWSMRDGTRSVFTVALEDPSFYLCVTDTCDIHLRADHLYYHQVQGAMHLTGAQTCDLFVWSPTDSEIVRVTREPGWAANLEKLDDFAKYVFVPYSLDHM